MFTAINDEGDNDSCRKINMLDCLVTLVFIDSFLIFFSNLNGVLSLLMKVKTFTIREKDTTTTFVNMFIGMGDITEVTLTSNQKMWLYKVIMMKIHGVRTQI